MKNKDFEEWLKAKDYKIESYVSLSLYFDKLPFSMQWGVYLEFFGSMDWHIAIEFRRVLSSYTGWRVDYHAYFQTRHGAEYDLSGFRTRTEAQQEAIKKAFEIYENQQTK